MDRASSIPRLSATRRPRSISRKCSTGRWFGWGSKTNMSPDSGFLYLNAANQWPGFDLHSIEIAADGALQLTQSGGKFVPRGVLLAGPVQAPHAATDWFRLTALADDLPDG